MVTGVVGLVEMEMVRMKLLGVRGKIIKDTLPSQKSRDTVPLNLGSPNLLSLFFMTASGVTTCTL